MGSNFFRSVFKQSEAHMSIEPSFAFCNNSSCSYCLHNVQKCCLKKGLSESNMKLQTFELDKVTTF